MVIVKTLNVSEVVECISLPDNGVLCGHQKLFSKVAFFFFFYYSCFKTFFKDF